MTQRAEAAEGRDLKRSASDHQSAHVSEQAVRGLNDFHQVKSGMAASQRETMKNYDGAGGAPTFANHDGVIDEKSNPKHNGEIKAPETNDHISHEPYAAAKQRQFNENAPMDEQGKRQGSDSKPNNPYSASSHVENGKVQSATLTDGNGSTTYNFDAHGKTASRVESRENGKYETKYGKDGHAASETFTDAAPGSKPQSVDFNKNDRSDVSTKNGRTTVTSRDGNATTALALDEKGNVQSSSLKTPKESSHTEYNKDGSMKSDSDVRRDEKGRVTSEETQTPKSDDRKEFDSNGNVVKTVHKDADTTHSREVLTDGSTKEQTVGPDGEKTVINTADGTKIEHSSDSKNQWSKVTKPDGSSVETTNNSYASTYKTTDKNGNWDLYQNNKFGGATSHYSGGPNSEISFGTKNSEYGI